MGPTPEWIRCYSAQFKGGHCCRGITAKGAFLPGETVFCWPPSRRYMKRPGVNEQKTSKCKWLLTVNLLFCFSKTSNLRTSSDGPTKNDSFQRTLHRQPQWPAGVVHDMALSARA